MTIRLGGKVCAPQSARQAATTLAATTLAAIRGEKAADNKRIR